MTMNILILLRASISICLKVYYFLQEIEVENSPIFLAWLFHDGVSYYIETSPLIYFANQCTGFYMIGTSAMKELIPKKVFQKAWGWFCLHNRKLSYFLLRGHRLLLITKRKRSLSSVFTFCISVKAVF